MPGAAAPAGRRQHGGGKPPCAVAEFAGSAAMTNDVQQGGRARGLPAGRDLPVVPRRRDQRSYLWLGAAVTLRA
jgi:hypothetical protein